MGDIVVVAQVVKKLKLEDLYFKKIINSFRHLELEIASAIPASNDEKYN